MKFRNNLPSIQEVKNMDMVDYLLTLGFSPAKVSGNNYWYKSPLRNEATPSFKINRSINRWYDFGDGRGGNIIDFGLLYHKCNVRELLKNINVHAAFQQPFSNQKNETDQASKIKVNSVHNLTSLVLTRHLHKRRIPLEIATAYCKEINYELYGKNYYAIGFKNDAGGYELRNEKFKSSSSPKDISFIQNNATKLMVFEGFFNFLSYVTIHQKQQQPATNFMVLNSTSFFEKSLPLMQQHNSVHLFLDCDTTGQECTQRALDINKLKFNDESHLYKNYEDLNDWLINIGKAQKQGVHIKH